MQYKRMPIEIESPEETGYDIIEYNLAESSVADAMLSEIVFPDLNLKLAYTDHRGKKELRALIAVDNKNLAANDILLTCGAAGALFIINTSLLTPDDHLIIVRPNYATNIQTPGAIGCSISFIDLQFESSWRLNIEAIRSSIQTNTKCISITTPHNPTGMMMTGNEIKDLIALAETHNIFLLVDETYRDTCFLTPYPVTASLSKKVISVSSVSKAYGLPGLRIGWAITQDKILMENLLAAKEMIHITNSALDEEIVYNFLLSKVARAAIINTRCLHNFEIVKQWLQEEIRLECVLPQGGVVCFPRFKIEINTAVFYKTLLEKYKTFVGAGHWFEMPDTYMRIGFGWTDETILTKGLENISRTIDEITSLSI